MAPERGRERVGKGVRNPMDVRVITGSGIEQRDPAELPDLLKKDDLVWVDIPTCDEDAVVVLRDVFGFHPLAVRDAVERNRVPRVHVYPDHVLLILHAPEFGAAGHVHYVELDQFVGPRYLVTVHGPVNPKVAPDVPLRETRAVLRRIEAGKFLPTTAWDLSHAIVSTLTRTQERFIEEVTRDVWELEQRVTAGHLGDPEQFLEELFRARHGLVAVCTMAALGGEVYGRIMTLGRFLQTDDMRFVEDNIDQFERVRSLAQGERDYLEGVIEFYRTRTETKMTVAAERLAVIAVVTLPITALSSILGMNIIVNAGTDFVFVIVVLLVMIAISATLLRWAKHQGWW
jgi:magnesium transporter